MKANTALGILLASLALALLPGRARSARVAGGGLAAAVALLAALTLAEWGLGASFGIDEALFQESAGAAYTSTPGRMSVLTATALLATGASIALRQGRTGRRLADAMAFATATFGFVALVGYIFGTAVFSQAPGFTPVALPTSLALLLLGTGTLACDIRNGLAALAAHDSPGGLAVRTLLPVLYAVLVGLGVAFLGLRQAGLEERTALALQFTGVAAILTPVVVALAVRMDRADAQRRHAMHAALRRTREVEAANRELESFAYTVSHDLRSPLRAMEGYANILATEHAKALPPEVRHYLEEVREGAIDMGRLVDELLAFSRLGKVALHRKQVDLAPIVAAVERDLRREEPKRKV